MPKKLQINISEIRGLTSLLADATVNVTDLVEDVNKKIVHPPFLISMPIQHLITGIAGFTYNNIRLTTKIIGVGLEKTLAKLNQQFSIGISFEKKENMIAVLNGVIGDYLIEKDNPIAIPMQLRYQGDKLTFDANSINNSYSKINGKILILVRGLCMNDIQWTNNDHNHGELLAKELDYIPIYLNYNSGLHISDNGQHFNKILEELSNNWPVQIEEINIIAHSMGGLISRSAFHYGKKENKNWTGHLKKIFFLGSPHHGAPLEQVGSFVDLFLEAMPYVKPFARIGKTRSTGITDLRFGNLVEEDWKDVDRFKNHPNNRIHIPLPEDVNCYAIAANIGNKDGGLKNKIVGDGLVQVDSALGQHKNSNKKLHFKNSNTLIVYENNHMDLLSNKKVYNKIKMWLLA